MRRSTIVLASLACSASLLLSACAEPAQTEAKDTTKITDLAPYPALEKGRTATLAAKDVTATGTIDVEGKPATITIRRGENKTQATVKGPTGNYEVLGVPGYIFVKTSKKTWEKLIGTSAAAQVGNRWVVSSDQGQLSTFASFVDLRTLFRTSGRIKKGKATKVNGTPSIALVDPPTNTDSTWWFASTGEPLLLDYRNGPNTRLKFDYEQLNPITVPNPSDIADIGTLQEGSGIPTTP